MSRVLVVASKRTYRLDDITAAGARLGLALVLATDRCHVLASEWKDDILTLRSLTDRDEACRVIAVSHALAPFTAIVGTCDLSTELAAYASRRLGLPTNPPQAAALARHKGRMRQVLQDAGVAVPPFHEFSLRADGSVPVAELVRAAEQDLGWPVVVKPVLLSGSRGVMRVDDAAGMEVAARRLGAILADPELRASGEEGHRRVLVERYVPGDEVAVEGLLRDGALSVLAFFDKPDPLTGPFFEETLYVTPSRHPPARQAAVVRAVQDAVRAMGLVQGPVHAEVRITPEGVPFVIEAAARSIGGLCSRMLRFGTGRTLDEVVLGAAVDRALELPAREAQAAGVMMIPVPRAGTLHGWEGEAEARAVEGVVEVTITARPHEELVPLPEGQSYLGFIFARARTPDAVEAALREAHRRLRFEVTPRLLA
ncbi:MAG: ATP-grasp domain-containing protein [Deltaproteobacteria bacterium]|nr:ATP-grasp domain-containing protein [Deltaproteobacteria bacterium]